ncbi:ATP-dependent nuclease [Nitrincola schmidtii]|uniref:ATP-dependent nuclease n=1 Tax=Nitrincola schmidtii TaxID=1730894 RepID=UPI0014575277|nr:AAA family ATPase [Nitrincola schmidtii]
MKIKAILIKNFRSIKDVVLTPSKFNILVGQNNHGKSNFFEAIEWFYNGKGDIFEIRHCDASSDEEVEVEIVFGDVQAGIAHITNEENQKKLRSILGDSDEMRVKRSSKSSKDRLIYDQSKSAWKKQPMGADSAFNNGIPRFEFIEATKNFKDVSAYKNTTPIGQMLSGLVAETLEKDTEYQAFVAQFERLFGDQDSKVRQALNGLSDSVSKYLQEQFPDCTKINFSVTTPAFDDFLKNYNTELDDGVVTKADDKGDGMQRALMLSIIKAHADFRRSEALGRSFIFFIDEAELHLHPTGQRHLKKSLLDLTTGDGNDQVFITTHSSVMIADGDQDASQTFFRVSKDDRQTSIEKITRTEKHTVVYDLLGGSPADILLPANFLIVEGPSEVKFYNSIISRFYTDKPDIHIMAANGDDEAQSQSMNGLNRVFVPLNAKPIYSDRLIVLCDKPDPEKQSRFDAFKKNNGHLERNNQLFLLPCNGLEDYYPPLLIANCTRKDKGKKARWMGENITQQQFESEMPIMAEALFACWRKAFFTDHRRETESIELQLEVTEQ